MISAVPARIYNSPNHGGRRKRTLGVILHSTRSGKLTREAEYQATIGYMLQAGTVSSHRVIGVAENQHAMCVEDDLEAWTAREYNATHLQIEICQPTITDEFSDYQYSCTAAVCKEWAKKYNFPLNRQRIRAHEEIPPGKRDGKTDVGPMWDWDRFMRLVKEA